MLGILTTSRELKVKSLSARTFNEGLFNLKGKHLGHMTAKPLQNATYLSDRRI